MYVSVVLTFLCYRVVLSDQISNRSSPGIPNLLELTFLSISRHTICNHYCAYSIHRCITVFQLVFYSTTSKVLCKDRKTLLFPLGALFRLNPVQSNAQTLSHENRWNDTKIPLYHLLRRLPNSASKLPLLCIIFGLAVLPTPFSVG